MELSIKNAAGTTLSFSGTRAELDVVLGLARDEGAALLAALEGAVGGSTASPNSGDHGGSSVRDLQDMLDKIDAESDVERAAVMAHFSVATTGAGLTAEKASQWYSELGLPKPGRWPSTFGNTKARGYIHNSSDGWRPTTAGENLVTHGIRRPSAGKRKRSGSDD